MKELIRKWREQASGIMPASWEYSQCRVILRSCADELEAALLKAEEEKPTATNRQCVAIADMDRVVRCLAIQLPETVYDDVKKHWDAVVAQQRT